MTSFLPPLACVLVISIGQILFRASARRLNLSSVLDPQFLATLGLAFALYGFASIAWVMILQKTELSKIYPFTALSFVFVPVFAYLVFRETVTPQYLLGVALIIGGIVVAGLKA